MIARVLVLTFLIAGVAVTQTQQPGQLADSTNASTSTPVHAMSVKEKVKYDAVHFFDVENLIFAGVGAAFDQGRNRPAEWGQGFGGFGERYASHVGQYLIQRTLMSTVRAVDHEDSRYFPSTHTNPGARIGDAFLHTVWRRNDNGRMMPAYSEILGDYGAATISRFWWPDHYHNATSILVAGSDTILIDGAINVFHEFWPDVKRTLHLRHQP